MTQEIDAEIISEEKLPERPREQRTVSLPTSAANAVGAVADAFDRVGAGDTANKVRAGFAKAAQFGQLVNDFKPMVEAAKGLVQDMKDSGVLKMRPVRRAFSPRKKVK